MFSQFLKYLPTIDQIGATRTGVSDAGAYEFGGTLSTENYTLLDQLKMYPNPAADVVYFEGLDSIDSIKFFSIRGSLERRIYNLNYLDVDSLANCMYIIQITK